ncbi:PD-(D/E)XK motif protein [Agromyces binzhouensis]|uniref:PD-(D/E)XK motif protein n=1 Tax=Agromyces binzhouensis TaxID=1817495 RepID=UPI003629225A
MTSIDEAGRVWLELLESGVHQHRLMDEHPLHLYFGIESAGSPVFLLVSEVQPKPPRISGVVTIQVRRREDGKWVAVLSLSSSDYADAFMGMCLELARRTAHAVGEAEAVGLFDATLNHWQLMLAGLTMRSLSPEQMRGLFAELTFGLELGRATSFREMVQSWDGPLGGGQDFRHFALGNFEVKAVGLDGKRVKISSLEQLDPVPAAKVDLVVIQVAEDPMRLTQDARTLPELIDEIRSGLRSSSDDLDAFDRRLAAVGIDTSDARYQELAFRCLGIRVFRTSDGFPRVESSSVRAGVENVRYDIRLTALEPFSIELGDALSASPLQA